MKVADLTAPELDYWVGKAEGLKVVRDWIIGDEKRCVTDIDAVLELYEPSTNWSDGGPIIEREGLDIGRNSNGEWWSIKPYDKVIKPQGTGPTPLIAAMRCYVAYKFGDDGD